MKYDKYVETVKRFYSNDESKYHTIYHVRDLFNLYEKYRFKFINEFPDLDEDDLFWTIAWHDSVYIVGNKLNEQFSAELYMEEMGRNYYDAIFDAILSTKIGTNIFVNSLEKVMHDLDWNSFGWPFSIFEKNVLHIRNEATCEGHYTIKEVKKNQLEFYKSLLGKDIFVTKTFSKLNGMAKKNVETIVRELENE